MPEPPHLSPLSVEEQQLYSELLYTGSSSHPVSKREPSHPALEAHFSHLYLRSCSFGHYPKLVYIGEASLPRQTGTESASCGRHTVPPVDLPLHFPLTR